MTYKQAREQLEHAVYGREVREALVYLFGETGHDKLQRTAFEKVCIYYGYPVGIGNTWSVAGAVAIYKGYDIVVFGDTYELPEHEVYSETVEILKQLAEEAPETRCVGYIPIGALEETEYSGLTMQELKRRVDLWAKIGAKGIFLDEFGFDYKVTRERQNEIVKYVHDKKMFCIANSWNTSYVFSSLPIKVDWIEGFDPNPNCLPPEINSGDYSLLENFFYTCEKDTTTGKVTLKSASCWRVDDGYGYYSRKQEEYGQTYYQRFGTKLLQLDAIPHDLSVTEKNTLMSLSIVGAKIFNIPALAFGDEDWGSSGYFYEWEIPTSIDLVENTTTGVHAVRAEVRGEDNGSFPYKWSATINGNTLSLTFDVQDGNDEVWDDKTHYAAVNDVIVRNAWQTIYEFGDEVKKAAEASAEAKKKVDEALPTLANAEIKMKALTEDAQQKIEAVTNKAQKTIDGALADVAGVTAGFGFKEVQW